MIYLVRHGEAASAWGQHPDPGLSQLGHKQAASVAADLSKLDIQHAITSPMQRCQETAAPFTILSALDLRLEPRVTEIPTVSGIEDRIVWLRKLMSGNWSDTPQQVQDWRSALIETVSSLPDNSVVFSHFIAINAIVGDLEGSDAVILFRPNHCSVTHIQPTNSGMRLVQRGAEASTKVL